MPNTHTGAAGVGALPPAAVSGSARRRMHLPAVAPMMAAAFASRAVGISVAITAVDDNERRVGQAWCCADDGAELP